MSIQYLIAFGSNLEPRLETIQIAFIQMEEFGAIEQKSSLYSSHLIEPADLEFINGAILLKIDLVPEPILVELLKIETSMGRGRDKKWGNRPIDLNIILQRYENTSRLKQQG